MLKVIIRVFVLKNIDKRGEKNKCAIKYKVNIQTKILSK